MVFLLYYCFQVLSLAVGVLGSADTSIEKRTVPEVLRTHPDGPIDCHGPLPPFWVPLPKTDEVEEPTLHDLCAKAGDISGPNVGGFCGDNFQIFFEPSFTQVNGRQIGNPRLFHYCKTRCVCEEHVVAESSRSAALSSLERTETLQLFPGDQTYMITLDEDDDYKVPPSMHMGESSMFVPTTAVFQRCPAYLWRISINQANSVTCSGPLPRNIPSPAVIGDYTDLQQLCAIQHFGGNPNANAGAYCHREANDIHVDFADELTPNLSWTSYAHNPPAANLRTYCSVHCHCRLQQEEEDAPDKSIPIAIPDARRTKYNLPARPKRKTVLAQRVFGCFLPSRVRTDDRCKNERGVDAAYSIPALLAAERRGSWGLRLRKRSLRGERE